MKQIAIIGFGCAAVSAIKALREHGCTDEIHVFAPASTPPENPMLTTYYASDRLPPDGRYPFGSVTELEEIYQVITHLGHSVTHVDTQTQTIGLDNGEIHRWDQLLIASGATPWAPPIEGDGQAEAFTMRTMADAHALRARIAKSEVKSVLVVGASMIGIKVVELFANLGISCTLADIAPHIFPLAALDGTALRVEAALAARGIDLRFGAGVSALHKLPLGGYCATFSNENTLECDLVILCVGTRSNLSFLTGDTVAARHGVVVDEHMATNVPNVYAAGDCCEGNNLQTHETQLIGLWASAGLQGRTAGICMAGGSAVCDGGMVQNITHFFDLDFISIGDKRLPGNRVVFETADLYIEANEDAGQLRCVNLLGGHRISGIVRNRMWRAARGGTSGLSPEEIGLLHRDGVPEGFIKLLGGTGL